MKAFKKGKVTIVIFVLLSFSNYFAQTTHYIPKWNGSAYVATVTPIFEDATNSRIGIGTTSPGQKLEVNGKVLLTSASYNSGFYIGDATNWGYTVSNSGSNYFADILFGGNGATDNTRGIRLIDKNSGTTVLFAGNSNNVGIGTTNPAATLHIVTAATSGDGSYINANTVTTGTGLTLPANGLTTGYGIKISSSSTGITTGSLMYLNSTGAIGNASGSVFNVTSSGVNTNGNVATIIGNSATTGNILNLSGTALTTGSVFTAIAGTTTGTAISLTANSVNSGKGLSLYSNGLTTGTALDVSSTSTAGTASNSSKVFNIARSGANANSSHTAYGSYTSVTNTGTTSTNVGGYFSASGATNNYALIVPSSGGSVGIGTTTPKALLSLGAATANTRFALYDDGTNLYGLGIQSNEFRFHVYSSTADFRFYDAPAGNALLTIKGNGKVGIGTTNPLALLSLGAATANTRFALYDDGTNLYGLGIQSNEFRFHLSSSSNDFRFYDAPAGNALFTIKGNGNVAIGTTTTSSKLQIDGSTDGTRAFVVSKSGTENFKIYANGQVYAREITVQLGAFPDYVFENTYKLRSIDELKAFIQKEKHLPSIPSASEVQNNGIGLGQLQTKLLEKVEELTLYIIDLNEKIKQLELANKQYQGQLKQAH